MGLFSFIKDLNTVLCNGISVAAKKSEEFNEEVTARCAENTLECTKRVQIAEQQLKELGFENIEEAEKFIRTGSREK